MASWGEFLSVSASECLFHIVWLKWKVLLIALWFGDLFRLSVPYIRASPIVFMHPSFVWP